MNNLLIFVEFIMQTFISKVPTINLIARNTNKQTM